MTKYKRLINVHYDPSICANQARVAVKHASGEISTSFVGGEESKSKEDHDSGQQKQILADSLRNESSLEMTDLRIPELQSP